MQYSRLGNTGLIVSRLGFGAMTFGEAAGGFETLYKVDQAGATALVAQAVDAGVTYFNTADVYAAGRSEEMLGRALGRNRRNVVIATKVGLRNGRGLLHGGLSRRHIVASCEASLRRLGTDWIDVYLLHRYDPHTPMEETLDALEQLKRDGKIRYAGFSNWPAWQAAKAVAIQQARHWSTFAAAEMHYSLVGRDIESEFLPFAADAGVGVTIWSPLAGGLLSGRYAGGGDGGTGSRLGGYDILEFDRSCAGAIVAKLASIACDLGIEPAQAAIAWLLARPAVATVILGASNAAQLGQTLVAADIVLPDDALAALDTISSMPPRYPDWLNTRIADGAVEAALSQTAPTVASLPSNDPPFALREIDHVVLRAFDAPALAAFYVEKLGCTREREADDLIQLRAGRALIDIVPRTEGEAGRNVDHICLTVSPFDVARITGWLASRGVNAGPPMLRYGAGGHGLSVYVSDPEGNGLEIKAAS